jgi:Kef-type K+ transport system membrane component KefB
MSEATVKRYKLVSSLSFGDVFLQTLIWLVLIVITFGIAIPFFGYYFLRLLINTVEIHEVIAQRIEPQMRVEPTMRSGS